MARRMDIELTSDRGDGTWTWRAAGARQPRGVIDAGVLGAEPQVGDVIRVEAEIELDGITITAVLPQRSASPRKGVIEIAGSGRPEPGAVTTSLLPRHERRGPRPPGDRRPRDEDRRPRAEDRRPRDEDRRPARSAERPTDRRPGEVRTEDGRGAPGRRPGLPVEGGAAPQPSEATGRPAADTRRHPPSASPARGAGREARPAGEGAPERARRARPPRLSPGTTHRDALLDTLAVEQRPIAEQLAIGGLPAVRRALAEERAAATEQGLPAASGDAIVAIAEQLLPAVREAVWLDRAEAAERILADISLRDLRAAVAGAAPRDDRGRELLRRLREALDARVARLRDAWERDMTHALEEGRVLQALRLSTRPPEPNTRFPAALVGRLADATGVAMTPTTSPDRWLALLEAASASPVGRLVKPAGVPDDAAVKRAASQAAGRIPALAPLLGLSMPPPPRPTGAAPAGRRSFGVPALGRRGAPRLARPATADPATAARRAPGALEEPQRVPEQDQLTDAAASGPPADEGAAAPFADSAGEPEPTPVEPEPTPVEPEPTPVEPEPTPVEPEPTPVEPEPTPVEPEPTPVEPEPTPVEPEPTPVEPEPPEARGDRERPEPLQDDADEPVPVEGPPVEHVAARADLAGETGGTVDEGEPAGSEAPAR